MMDSRGGMMLRKTAVIVGAMLLCGLVILPADAGTPKVVVAENYGATW